MKKISLIFMVFFGAAVMLSGMDKSNNAAVVRIVGGHLNSQLLELVFEKAAAAKIKLKVMFKPKLKDAAPRQNSMLLTFEPLKNNPHYKLVLKFVSAIELYVHKNNPIDTMTSAELRSVVAGIVDNWQSLNREDRKIHLYAVGEKRNTALKVLLNKLFSKSDAYNKFNILESYNEMNILSDADRNSISLCPGFKTLNSAKLLAINGVLPEKKTVMNGKYPFSVHCYVYCPKSGNEKLSALFSGLNWKKLAGKGFYIISNCKDNSTTKLKKIKEK